MGWNEIDEHLLRRIADSLDRIEELLEKNASKVLINTTPIEYHNEWVCPHPAVSETTGGTVCAECGKIVRKP